MRFLCLAFVLLWPVAAAADFDAGVRAYERGDYAMALREFRPLAKQGLARAQFNLGLMYAKGEGVPKDYVQAYAWFNLAAAQGNAKAAQNKALAKKHMTASQIARAQSLSTALAQRIRGGGPNTR